MNTLQLAFAKTDSSLGNLLNAIEQSRSLLPETVVAAFDALGVTSPHGCHCDLEPGQEPDGCVLDEGRPQDCVYASNKALKQECEYWKPIKFQLPA
jgi:hypothetical protein